MPKHLLMNYSEIDRPNFPHHIEFTVQSVNAAIKKFALWNRMDLVENLKRELESCDQGHLLKLPEMQSLQIGHDEVVPYRLLSAKKPLANPKDIIPHRGSVIAFLKAKPGHTFTGLVMAGHVEEKYSERVEGKKRITEIGLTGRPKMFLFPAGPGKITTNDNTTKNYSVLPHEEPKTKVYDAQLLSAILHRKNDVEYQKGKCEGIIAGNASHIVAANLVKLKNKYQSLSQSNGDFVGFTVCKGTYDGIWRNRYSTTSLSSNAGAFDPDGAGPERYYPTKDWVDAITSACDKLLIVEQEWRRNDTFVKDLNSLGAGKASSNDVWKFLKNNYWPIHSKDEIKEAEMDEDEDW